ncbi:MAG: acetyl-CoA carboxylase biotin carboxylase subunit [bacterium]
MFRKILIANRGEIALRILRACRSLGIKTVLVFSEADRYSLGVKYADETFCIGPPQASKSYLNIPNIIAAAEISGADAIHPGYGFLAENADFAEVCESCGIKFIGPSSKIISLMGDKIAARKVMYEAGVPVIPGTFEPIEDEKQAISIAREFGFPLIIKAAGGGGGRGMRIVRDEDSLKGALMVARSEAEAAFNNGAVYIEKYIEGARHIEVQILGDGKGNVVHFFERDCSIQRRHQKLIEESPAIGIPKEVKEKLLEAAIKGARAINYESVGTLEFLLDKDNNFYFMEMNTRIQVEHPVTEMVTGHDLIKYQILVASGEDIPVRQEDIVQRGHAIECRINAEDPFNNFLPSTGTLKIFSLPGGPGIRIDSAIYNNIEILPYYDSLIAKLISWGLTREEAISRMRNALDEFLIEGIKTTIPLYLQIMNDSDYIAGNISINFLEERGFIK